MDLTKDREIDIALRVDQISEGRLLGVRACAVTARHLTEGEVIRRSNCLVRATDHNHKAVVFLDDGFVFVTEFSESPVVYILEIQDLLRGSASERKR